MKSKCGNCGWTGEPLIELADIENLEQRLDIGGTVPSGECPECQALCYESPKPIANKSHMGAKVQYCGHDASFYADIIDLNGVCLVVGMPKIDNVLARPAVNCTHHLKDFPRVGYWSPLRGFFMVPSNQVIDLRAPKSKAKKVAAKS